MDDTDLTYPEIGATRREPLPPGYRHLHYRTSLGRASFVDAAEAVLTFAMHRAAGVGIEASGARVAVGLEVASVVGVGPLKLREPCRVVWVDDEADRAGFGYGTLPGHIARGEESFVVTRAADGVVWFSVTAFSRPAGWPMALAGPLGPVLQRAYAANLARGLRRRLRDPAHRSPGA